MNYEEKKKELEEQFKKVQEEISQLERIRTSKLEEALILKGKFAAFEEMEAEETKEKEVPEEKKD